MSLISDACRGMVHVVALLRSRFGSRVMCNRSTDCSSVVVQTQGPILPFTERAQNYFRIRSPLNKLPIYIAIHSLQILLHKPGLSSNPSMECNLGNMNDIPLIGLDTDYYYYYSFILLSWIYTINASFIM